jgi:hypothetical protein
VSSSQFGSSPSFRFQSYPVPTELPAMRAGELDGRYLDCTPALAPVGDTFVAIPTITIRRIDGTIVTSDDLASAGSSWPDTIDATNRIPTYGFVAGVETATYLLRMAGTTAQGRTFVRDWRMSVLPELG